MPGPPGELNRIRLPPLPELPAVPSPPPAPAAPLPDAPGPLPAPWVCRATPGCVPAVSDGPSPASDESWPEFSGSCASAPFVASCASAFAGSWPGDEGAICSGSAFDGGLGVPDVFARAFGSGFFVAGTAGGEIFMSCVLDVDMVLDVGRGGTCDASSVTEVWAAAAPRGTLGAAGPGCPPARVPAPLPLPESSRAMSMGPPDPSSPMPSQVPAALRIRAWTSVAQSTEMTNRPA